MSAAFNRMAEAVQGQLAQRADNERYLRLVIDTLSEGLVVLAPDDDGRFDLVGLHAVDPEFANPHGVPSSAAPAEVSGRTGSHGAARPPRTRGVRAGAVIAALPVLLLYIILQRYIVESVATTGLAGQ